MTAEEEKLLAAEIDKAIRSTDMWTLMGRGLRIVAQWDEDKEETSHADQHAGRTDPARQH